MSLSSSSSASAESTSPISLPMPLNEFMPHFKDSNKSPQTADYKIFTTNLKKIKSFTPISIDLKDKIQKLIINYSKRITTRLSISSSSSTPTSPVNIRKDRTNGFNQSLVESRPGSASSPKNADFDEKFIAGLFDLLLKYNYEDKTINNNLEQISNELQQSHVIKNVFLVIAKLGHEFFKLGMLNVSECLLEFTINQVDTASLRLKMATLSTLSACYWRQSKFIESIDCMNLELKLAAYLNSNSDNSTTDNTNKEVYLNNIYRIYGNLASAYQRLNRLEECLENFQMQLEVSLDMKDDILIINTNNSIGLVYNKMKDYDNSLKNFEKSLELIEVKEGEIDSNQIILKRLKLSQYNLIGECCLKLCLFEKARENFLNQLKISYELTVDQEEFQNRATSSQQQQKPIESISIHQMQESLALFSLALISSKLKNNLESIEYYEACLSKLQTYFNANHSQQILEVYGRIFIGLINNYLSLKETIKASLYAHTMLDFTLKEITKLNDENKEDASYDESKMLDKSFNSMNKNEEEEQEELLKAKKKKYQYLKFIEMTACSKLATCYLRQNRLVDAFKLHQREATLAMQLNNTLYLTRAYSHMAQIYFHTKDYEKCIFLYKQILHTIELSLLDSKDTDKEEGNEEDCNDFDFDLGIDQTSKPEDNNSTEVSSSIEKYNSIRDERLIQMIYFTLSNIGLCMEMLNRFDDSRLMFFEQFEISKLIKNSKFKANALLNLVNLYLNKTKIDSNSSVLEFSTKSNNLAKRHVFKNPDHVELVQMLRQLFDIYQELADLNGKLFTSQCLAYCYHTSGSLKLAIKFYKYNIKSCRGSNNLEMLTKSLFNLSLCYKMQNDFENAYKLQMEYYEIIDKKENNNFAKFTSLGLIAGFLFEIDKSEESLQKCIQIHIDRLKIIKSIDINLDTTGDEKQKKTITDDSKCKLISDCLESIAKLYYETENYQQVLKFKLLQVELHNELEQNDDENEKKSVNKLKILLDIGNLFLFKFEDASEAYKYFEIVLEIARKINDLLLQSLVLGNMGLCKQKIGDYDESLEFFKDQLIVLDKKLKTIDEKSILTKIKPITIKPIRKSDLNSSSSDNLTETPSDSLASHFDLKPTCENINQIKEIISIRIDMGRAYSKLGKCNELLSHHKVQSQLYLNESLKYFNEYCRECEFLFENYVKGYFLELKKAEDKFKQGRKKSDESWNSDSSRLNQTEDSEQSIGLSDEIHELMKDLCEQIYIDYDASFAKLANFYSMMDSRENNGTGLEKAIDINEKRLTLLNYTKPILNRSVWANFCIQINFLLANFYSNQMNTLVKSKVYCENIILLYTEDPLFDNFDEENSRITKTLRNKLYFLKDNIYLIETLNLLCDISLVTKNDSLDYDLLIDKALKAYKMIWQSTKPTNTKVLKLKFDSICRLVCIYRRLKMPKECLEILMEGSSRFTFEFQQLQAKVNTEDKSESTDKSTSSEATDNKSKSPEENFYLIQYIEYLFLIHRKIALIHIKHAIESNLIAKNKDLVEKSFFLALKYVNEALTYLNYQKEFQIGQIIEYRQASIYFLLGKCHKFLKNTEMELEMFANALDLYENIVPQNTYNSETIIKDRITTTTQQTKGNNSFADLFEAVKNDDDEETVVKYIERIDQLYQYIEDALIKMNKLKEALLVTERHRAKKSSTLLNLPELVSFDQIEELLENEQLHAVIYFSRIEVSSKINCWLILPKKGIQKFHQISFKSFDKIFSSKKKNSNSNLANLTNEIQKCATEKEQNNLLRGVYDSLIQPIEELLFDNLILVNDQFQTKQLTKPSVYIAYDEDMFKIPFHLLKTTKLVKSQARGNGTDKKDNYLFEVFELDCGFSLKFLFKNLNYSRRFVKHQTDVNKSSMPMRVISNEDDMEKLLTTTTKNNQYQYDLLLLLVDSENKDIKALNSLVNTLLSQKLSKAVLLEFNYTNTGANLDAREELAKSEAYSKQFLSTLYSKLSNRSSLKATLILKTISGNNENPQQKLLNYLIFGHLNKCMDKIEPQMAITQSESIPKPIQSSSDHKPRQEHIKEEKPQKREASLEKLLNELSQESEEVTFSQIIVQFIKLNSKFEHTSTILNIIVTILDDFLCDRLIRDAEDPGSVTLKNLFQSFSKVALQNNQLVASRLMLKKLGFNFYIDSSARYLTRLPHKSLEKKLNLIYRCLLIFQTFSHKLLQGLFERTKTKSGKELISLLQKFKSNSKQSASTVYNMSLSSYTKHESFLNEFSKITYFVDYVRVESDSEVLNNLILIATIVLNDDMKTEAESSLQNYIEVFFRNMDGDEMPNSAQIGDQFSEDDEDLTSQYSSLSSMLGFQPPEKIQISNKRSSRPKINDDYEIEIEHESSEPKISKQDILNAKKSASQFQKIIEINGKNDSPNCEYDEYLSELVRKERNKPIAQPQNVIKKNFPKKCFNQVNPPNSRQSNHLIYDPEDEFKCKSLVHLEEKEYFDQFTTTTTTVRTKTKDDLFLLFDNNFFGNENHSEDHLNEFFNQNTTRKSHPYTISRCDKPKLVNINKNIYSCLNNYFSDANTAK